LSNLVPYGLIATREWLLAQGLTRHQLDNWVKSDKLSKVAQGVYRRPEAKLTWQGIVCSLQRMGSDLHPGGLTAFELQGLGHYLSLSKQQTLHLYGADPLPAWVDQLLADVRFVRHSENNWRKVDQAIQTEFLVRLTWGLEDWPLMVAAPELALLEALADIPNNISFEHVDQLMQGLANLSPRRLNKLLELFTSVKVRRLFFWFAEKHHHAWYKKLDVAKYTLESGELGSGKRVIAKGGKLNSKYQITVPEVLNG
jgi:transcriptional regulator with AbiEi antitoxin domain of type IV toxin-antitoxin system